MTILNLTEKQKDGKWYTSRANNFLDKITNSDAIKKYILGLAESKKGKFSVRDIVGKDNNNANIYHKWEEKSIQTIYQYYIDSGLIDEKAYNNSARMMGCILFTVLKQDEKTKWRFYKGTSKFNPNAYEKV